MKSRQLVLLFGITMIALSAPLSAGPFVFDGRSTCGMVNCNSRVINGTYRSASSATSTSQTYVVETFCREGDCCRYDVVAQDADMEMAVVSPNPAAGTSVADIWADDDSGVGLQPLIVIDPAPRTGTYTVIVSAFSAATSGTKNLTLRYGRYNSGNTANCSSPSTPGALQYPAEPEYKLDEAQEAESAEAED